MKKQTKYESRNSQWHSSYEANNYGDLFYALVRIYKPEKIVELGTKAGYSAYHMARGLRDNKKGTLDCYDLWEKYQFHSVSKSIAEKNLKEFKKNVNLELRDALGIEKLYKKIDILHVDISNDGKILDKIIPRWIDKVGQFVIIEGGSSERDSIEWMVKYKKEPISKWLRKFKKTRKDLEYFTLTPFPSVTLIRKREI